MNGLLHDTEFTSVVDDVNRIASASKTELLSVAEKVADRTEVGLTSYADAFIPSRGERGDMRFSGHGWIIEDDLFSVAGRANWALEMATCKTFGSVEVQTRTPRLALLAYLWKKELEGGDIGLRLGDPRTERLTLMSRRAIQDAIGELAMAEVTRAKEEQANLARRLSDATGRGDLGESAAAWSRWLDASWSNLYFDWRKMQMVVANAPGTAIGEDTFLLPTRSGD